MKNLNKKMQECLDKMTATGKLFVSSVSGKELWDIYLKSFKPEDDQVFRDPASSEHNCKNCYNFIKNYGNIVAIDSDLNILTMFDFIADDEEYRASISNMAAKLKNSAVSDVFFETFDFLNQANYEKCTKAFKSFKLGIESNHKIYNKEEVLKYGVVEENKVYTFEHFMVKLPEQFVLKERGVSLPATLASFRTNYEVFKRTMEEISANSFSVVSELISQGSLLNSDLYATQLNTMEKLKLEYMTISSNKKRNLWCKVTSYKLSCAKLLNTLIGTVLTDVECGEELEKVCRTYNYRVDPANYMKATSPITKTQIKEAQKFVEENNYTESFTRRYATLDDIKASEILHLNSDSKKIKSVSIFDQIQPTSSNKKELNLDKIKEISINDFMEKELPNAKSVELYLENRHENNLVSITTAENKDSKRIFKWDNNYSWTFKGNLSSTSLIKQNVNKFGGKTEGALRFSIMWNEDGRSICDLDAHCYITNLKGGRLNHIYYADKQNCLDVDMINPREIGVENIIFNTNYNLNSKKYIFKIVNFNGGKNSGFKAEIEFNNQLFSYELNKELTGDIHIATVEVGADGKMSIYHNLPATNVSKNLFGLSTLEFHKVKLVCLSPNYWDTNAIGNKHYMFMLENCINPEKIKGFHVDNLKSELATHRKVLEVVGNTTMIEPSDATQLSGLGFNSTIPDSVIVKINSNKVLKIKI